MRYIPYSSAEEVVNLFNNAKLWEDGQMGITICDIEDEPILTYTFVGEIITIHLDKNTRLHYEGVRKMDIVTFPTK